LFSWVCGKPLIKTKETDSKNKRKNKTI